MTALPETLLAPLAVAADAFVALERVWRTYCAAVDARDRAAIDRLEPDRQRAGRAAADAHEALR
jgi:hypothetical protein